MEMKTEEVWGSEQFATWRGWVDHKNVDGETKNSRERERERERENSKQENEIPSKLMHCITTYQSNL